MDLRCRPYLGSCDPELEVEEEELGGRVTRYDREEKGEEHPPVLNNTDPSFERSVGRGDMARSSIVRSRHMDSV